VIICILPKIGVSRRSSHFPIFLLSFLRYALRYTPFYLGHEMGHYGRMDLIAPELDHDQAGIAVRAYSASHLYDLIEGLKPQVELLLRGGGMSSVAAEALAQAQLLRIYLAAIKDLGKLYQVDKPPAIEEEMIPASQLPAMIEAAVSVEVDLAVEEALRAEREAHEAKSAVSAKEAKDQVARMLGRARSRA